MAEGVFECVVQHGRAHVQEGLHGRPAPAHLLLLGHALGYDLVDRAFHERRHGWSLPTGRLARSAYTGTDRALPDTGARIRGAGAMTPTPFWAHAMRADSGRPSSSMRFRTWTATSISVARRSSVRERSPSPITRLNRPTVASARARAL